MQPTKIDFRSDTLTKPTPGMLRAMASAEVGDDVFGEDPTINQLESKLAQMFNVQAAMFCPSGTMTNQIAIKCHTQPGDEVICDENSHVYQYEGGGISFHSAASVKLLQGDRGRITAEMVQQSIRGDDIHYPRSRLVCLENTANRGGGSCYSFDEIQRIHQVCQSHQLALHLDGARLWNVLVTHPETAADYGRVFDSISVCLSKGLGCPVGSLLLGSNDLIRQARRYRKLFGGGMRQAGSLAAAGIYALQHHVERLQVDHRHAQQLGEVLRQRSIVKRVLPVETNIVVFELQPQRTATEVVEWFAAEGIWVLAIAPDRIRLVTHLDITKTMMERALQVAERM